MARLAAAGGEKPRSDRVARWGLAAVRAVKRGRQAAMALASGGETPVKRAWSSTGLAAVRACSSLEAS